VGTQWRVNFFRMDQPSGRPQAGSGWSPPLVGDFHALDKFGILIFGDEKGKVAVAAAPVDDKAKKAAEGDKGAKPGEAKPGEAKPGETKKEPGKQHAAAKSTKPATPPQ
jgi:hypothetical protein